REMVRIQECELVESFDRAQSDYGLSTGLALISEIAERTLPEQEVGEPMFRLLLLTAREVERRSSWELPLSYFAFWTVKLGGYLPPLERCSNCGRALGQHPGFHFGQAGDSCARAVGGRGCVPSGRAAGNWLAFLRASGLTNWRSHPSFGRPCRNCERLRSTGLSITWSGDC